MSPEMVQLLGGMAALLTLFTGVIFWSVRSQVDGFTGNIQKHIDTKLEGVAKEVSDQTERLNKQEEQIRSQKAAHAERMNKIDREQQDQKVAHLELRNEMLENMRNTYVRHSDIEDINNKITALFDRMDKVIFRRPDQ